MEIEKHINTIEQAEATPMDFDSIISGNLIEDTLQAFADNQGIDLNKCPLKPWQALLQEIGAVVFGNRDVLKMAHPINHHLNNIYDLNKIMSVCDIYIHLSNRYNKLISVISFAYLLNMSITTMYNILNDSLHLQGGAEFNALRKEIYKKLYIQREEDIKNKCFESSSPVGVIALANNEFGWNGNGGQIEQGNGKTLSISSLPTLQAIESH